MEPRTGPPDAFKLAPRILSPGQRLSPTCGLAWDVGEDSPAATQAAARALP